MKDEIKENNSVMKCCICNNENIGEFIVIEDKKYHLNCITNLQEKSNNQAEEINRLVKQREKFMKKYGYLKEENERLLKTQEMYEKKCNKIHQYITQNCEIIRHKDYDEIGKVNGKHILFLLNGGDEE